MVGKYNPKRDRPERRTPEHRAKHSASERQRKTGVSPAMFADLWALQGGKCGCCGNPLTRDRFTHADHDHASRTPRGLLCHPCNTAEGLIASLGLTPAGFGTRMQRYLDDPPARDLDLV